MARTLNVKKVPKFEVAKKWKLTLPFGWDNEVYATCNSNGEVNWDKTKVYQE